MEPLAIASRPDGEWTLVHKCRRCGVLNRNRIAGDDDPIALMALAVRPLAHLSLPADRAGPHAIGMAGSGGRGVALAGSGYVSESISGFARTRT